MNNMFFNATSFDSPIFGNTSNVINMTNMFNGATSFNQSIGAWDTSNVTSMRGMFKGATSFDHQSIKAWKMGKVPSGFGPESWK